MKKAVIIGASSGIGRELAIQLARLNYQLGLMARRESLLQELSTSLPGEHFTQAVDLVDAERSQEQLLTLAEKMGSVDLIIVNSGVGNTERKLNWEIQREMIDVNVRGFAAMSMTAMNYFEKQRSGHLVGVSSIAAHISGGLTLTYHATKAFDSNYLSGMRSRATRSGLPITVTTVEPGFVDTPMVQGSPMWMASVERAVRQIVKGIQRRRNHIYVTKRWRFVVWFARLIPNWLFRKFI
jgi:short-subunit dehydrogenase